MSNLRKAIAPIKKYPKTLARRRVLRSPGYDRGMYGTMKYGDGMAGMVAKRAKKKTLPKIEKKPKAIRKAKPRIKKKRYYA